MKKHILYRDAWLTIKHSFGRFMAIFLLMVVSSFTLIGLKMTGPDMRQSARDFFKTTQLADLTITNPLGLDRTTIDEVREQPGIKKVETGFQQDVIFQKNQLPIRVFSNSHQLSKWQLVSGHFPHQSSEMAVSYLLQDKFHIGQMITIPNHGTLKAKRFKIVGFVRSSEYLDRHEIGNTILGDGQLAGVAVVNQTAFHQNTSFSVVRIKYGKNVALSPKRDQLAKQLPPTDQITIKTSYPGYATFQANAKRVDILANVFPILLFLVAALVSLTTMTRLVDEERLHLGTFKALGYSNLDVAKKFILFSALSATFGVMVGAVGGFLILPKQIFRAYTANSTISDFTPQFSWSLLLITWVIALLCTTGAALWVLAKDLKDVPAMLLLPKPPKSGARILLERWSWLWHHLSFNQKVTLRNLFRFKSRALMTVIGVAGCTGLLFMGLAIRNSLSGISQLQYGQIIKYDLIAVQNPQATPQQQQALTSVLQQNSIQSQTGIYLTTLRKKVPQDTAEQSINLIVPRKPQNLDQYIKLQDRSTKHSLKLPANGVIISEKLAQLLNVHVGNQIKLRDQFNQVRRVRVKGIAEMYLGHYMLMSPTAYQKVCHEPMHVNANLIVLNHDKHVSTVSKQLLKTGAIIRINQNLNHQRTIDNTLTSLNQIMGILIGLATILAFVVIYNLSNINIEERMRELSTIKVLGFYEREVTMYIYRETIALTVIGIGFGYLVGIALHRFILLSLPPTDAMFDPTLRLSTFIISAIVPLMITLIVAYWLHKKIQHVNMLDALSSND